MTDLVQLNIDKDIAIITINNPPVNALSPGVPEGISKALDRIVEEQDVSAIVLIGAGRTFVAGADIKEFGKITSGKPRGAGLLPLLLKIEDSSKPVIVAIHGTAFGGGLELAMAGHYRVAVSTAQFGQPEVNLGLIPGAAGTQRLPRLAGVDKAVEMCTSGNPLNAQEALRCGILDRVVEGDLLTEAVAFAREVGGNPTCKTRARNEKLHDHATNAAVFSSARQRASKKRGLFAHGAAIDAVEAATTMSFEQGCEFEQKLFMDCLFSEQSRALIHVFLSEREVSKIPDIPKETALLPIRSAAVVGAGTMGGGIAMVLANAGIPVLLKDTDKASLDRGLATIQLNYANSVARGRFSQQVAEERIKRITPTLTTNDFSNVDLIIEAVFEGMAVKREVFKELDRVCKANAILASNTSTLSIDEIASATGRPEYVIGTHFFSPANVMRLLEIVRGKATSKEVIATVLQFSKAIGKIGVLVGNCRGFVGNRMFGPYRREAQFLVEEGASIESVDRALSEFGMAMGPLATGDLAGLDVGWRIRKEYRHLEPPQIRKALIEDRLCELGRYGQKTRAGWYQYDDHRRAIPDPAVDQLIHKWVKEANIPQRNICAEEITERCLYTLVNEGARILEEGYALRASDIDVIYVNGYGFPAHFGGPMWYADTLGLKQVYERVCEFQRQHGEIWRAAPLLEQLAAQSSTFADFDRRHGTLQIV